MALASAACGSVHAGGSPGNAATSVTASSVASAAGGTATGTPSPAPTPPPGPAEARARHDRLFPQVAAECAGVAATPLPTPIAPPTGARDPWADKYAENHGFRTTATLLADGRCRGEAHRARIADALRRDGRTAGLDRAGLRALLEALGYRAEETNVSTDGGSLGFSLWIPEAGPCVTGVLTTPPTIEAHGPYLEGGCTEPKGGH
ncbi:hypothetical protein ACFYUY_39230 [Kitasatospora sp. NPDC004745]|uniref:hypothetical protein n=1 Tax=Kitasatospora sp. NPDC004745 TaxID=3364019 RepID=UPI00369E2034